MSHFLNGRIVTEAARTGVALAGAWRHRRVAPERIRAYQDQRVRQLVAHAYARVPYYRKLLDRHGGDVAAAEKEARNFKAES